MSKNVTIIETVDTEATTESASKSGRPKGWKMSDDQLINNYSRGAEVHQAYADYIERRFGPKMEHPNLPIPASILVWLSRNTTVWNDFRDTPEYGAACTLATERREREEAEEAARKAAMPKTSAGRPLKLAETEEEKDRARQAAITSMRKLGMSEEAIAALFAGVFSA